MRISFSSVAAADAAAKILEEYGFSVKQTAADLTTDCPPLLAAPAIARGVGLRFVKKIYLRG
jgi:hypothetical protein